MAQKFLKIRGIDPLLFRDGRPFTADEGGLTARSLPLPFPTTIAAFVRSQIGRRAGWDWSDINVLRRAHTIPVDAPLLQANGAILLPAPIDAMFAGESNIPVRLTPQETKKYRTDIPDGLWPVMPAAQDEVTAKASSHGSFWTRQAMMDWLEEKPMTEIPRFDGLPEEERIGIQINRKTRGAEESRLYAVNLRGFEELRRDAGGIRAWNEYALIARTNMPDEVGVESVGTLGGERRMTSMEMVDDTPEIWPRCPSSLKERLGSAKRVRMILATPAHFAAGWKPAWIDSSGLGESNGPPGVANVKLQLVGAVVNRRIPMSGWRMRQGENGPRAIKWLAPAGSVYFFIVESGDSSALWRDAWLQPMSDIEQDRRDGLGLALWGTW
jgi:CRISPR-associated protein Cmr3